MKPISSLSVVAPPRGRKTMSTAGSEEERMCLIRAVQAGVPFVPRPFAAFAEQLGTSEEAVIAGLLELSEQGVLREISAVLEGSALGYDSALVAGRVPGEALEHAVEAVNTHPTVTHNYLRGHHYNLWFTIAVPPQMDLERTLELLAAEAGVDVFHPLRRTHIFKIGVNFDPGTLKNTTTELAGAAASAIEVGEIDKRRFRALQRPLPYEHEPFAILARESDDDPRQLLEFANRHFGGAIRRYVGTLRHRKLGVRENGMAVWKVAPENIDAVGLKLAQAPEVSHCYARNSIAGFPYTVYSMVHGPTRESCEEIARELSEKTGEKDYAVLFSEREFKKQRLCYFLPDLDAWWAQRVG